MNKAKWLVAAVVALVAVGAIYLVLPKDDDNNPATSNTTQNTDNRNLELEESTAQEETQTGTITAAQVAEHNSRNDCWTIIDGSVYNITPFISQHPGGDEILRACGTDGSTLFNDRETESGEEVGSGTPHSSTAERTLQQFFVGKLGL